MRSGRDKRNVKQIDTTEAEVEDVAEKNDLRTLYMTTWKLIGISCNQNCPIRNEDRTPLSRMKDQLQRWKKDVESVLSRPAPNQLLTFANLRMFPRISTQD